MLFKTLIAANILVFIYFQFVAGTLPTDIVSGDGSEAPAVVAENSATGQSIRLLHETLSQTSAQAAEPEVGPDAIGVPIPKKPVCTLVGSFEKLLQAEYFVERLVALGLSARVKQVIVASKPAFWLYLTPEASRKEALRRLRELQNRGIDSYVIPSGERTNGVSLGVFSKREGAEVLQARVEKLGYSTEIIGIPREQKEIWVLLPQGEAVKLSRERWAELISSGESLQKRQNFCADIASA